MAGLYGGTMTVGELLEHGDLGLGTLDSIDGELIVLDGKAYQAKGSGEQPEIVEVSPDALIPYAAVVPHQAEVIFRQRFEMTDKELEERIESYYDGENLFPLYQDSWGIFAYACAHDSQVDTRYQVC